MRLILETPALQAHSVLRYAEWRAVIASTSPADSGYRRTRLPTTVGHVSLALAVASYERWLAHDHLDLTEVLVESMAELRAYVISI